MAAVAGPDGVECWVAVFFEYLEGLDWVPTDCPGADQDNESHSVASVAWAGYSAVVVGRIETFGGPDRVSSGADVHTRFNQPPGWLASYSYTYMWNGSYWTLIGNTGWRYNSSWTDDFAPTYRWGVRTPTYWYGSWSSGYRWTGGFWLGGWWWSGATYLCGAHCAAGEPPVPVPSVTQSLPEVPS